MPATKLPIHRCEWTDGPIEEKDGEKANFSALLIRLTFRKLLFKPLSIEIHLKNGRKASISTTNFLQVRTTYKLVSLFLILLLLLLLLLLFLLRWNGRSAISNRFHGSDRAARIGQSQQQERKKCVIACGRMII